MSPYLVVRQKAAGAGELARSAGSIDGGAGSVLISVAERERLAVEG